MSYMRKEFQRNLRWLSLILKDWVQILTTSRPEVAGSLGDKLIQLTVLIVLVLILFIKTLFTVGR